VPPDVNEQKQSDYMKQWLCEKRTRYLERLLQMKAGPGVYHESRPSSGLVACPRCRTGGRPVWRCLDCTDKTAVCVLCCRNAHKLDIFHRIEKWNGRYYQKGALWQVGVKIYAGHNGQACPRSVTALSALNAHFRSQPQSNSPVNHLADVAREFGKTETEVLVIISDALDAPSAAMKDIQKDILSSLAQKSGLRVFDLLEHLKSSLTSKAEEEAEALQSEADSSTAVAENIEDDNQTGPYIVADILEEEVGGEDDDWEDEDDRPAKGDLPRYLPRPPTADGAGNPFMTVAHTNGFHSLPVVWCACQAHLEDRDLQLLDLHLYPASYDRIKTVFTFACLDDHRCDYLECKSSHYQYHNKLRRLTSPAYPDLAPNRYTELCRVARQWRNLKYRKWFWLLDSLNAKRATMALFCAACPQPGVNLEPDWKAEHDANP
jgi:hypothetical protein